jgi:L-2-hydroxycarboxylate dehydrogenase (NAD+)
VSGARTVVVPAAEVRSAVRRVLDLLGARPEDAEIVTDVLVEADLREQHSHGVLRLPTIAGRVRAGLIRVDAEPTVITAAGATTIIEADRGFGHATAKRAMALATEIAGTTGIAMVGVRDNNHIGMLGYYAEQAARAGFVAMISTTTEAFVHPFGGSDRLLGTNPIAIGIPALPEPFVLDFSTSATAIGKIIDAAQRGAAIPDNWAVDPDGDPTTDAERALAGAINPFGGAKGYGLGLAVALLAGVMLDTAANPEVHGTLDIEFAANKGDLFIAVDPRVVPGGSAFEDRSGAFLEQIRTSRPEPGSDHVLVPGDRGAARKARAELAGIELSSSVWTSICELAASLEAERDHDSR